MKLRDLYKSLSLGFFIGSTIILLVAKDFQASTYFLIVSLYFKYNYYKQNKMTPTPPQRSLYRIAEYKGEFTIEKLTTTITKNKGYLNKLLYGSCNETQEYLPLRTNSDFSKNKGVYFSEIKIFKSLKEAEIWLNKIKFQTEIKYYNY
jgi:hypothetical protein